MKNKLLVICGPTATGKTRLAVQLAKNFSGEIVSADSRQVYKGMDIGTGKDLPVNSKFKILNFKQIPNFKSQTPRYQIGYYQIEGVKVWLYDLVEPDYQFSVADWLDCASLVIKDIWRRRKLPILVGGTGFYIQGLIDGIGTLGVSPDWELREKLRNLEVEKLSEMLKKIWPERWQKMNRSDRQNPRRLIRAIEIAAKVKNAKLKIKNWNSKLKIKDKLIIGLKADYKTLYQRIDRRVEERIKQGVVDEIKNLLKKGYGWENSVLGTTIGYKEWKDFFEGKVGQEEAVRHWKFSEHAYARRQMTWFKKDKRIIWFDISSKNWQNKVIRKVENWLNEGKNF